MYMAKDADVVRSEALGGCSRPSLLEEEEARRFACRGLPGIEDGRSSAKPVGLKAAARRQLSRQAPLTGGTRRLPFVRPWQAGLEVDELLQDAAEAAAPDGEIAETTSRPERTRAEGLRRHGTDGTEAPARRRARSSPG